MAKTRKYCSHACSKQHQKVLSREKLQKARRPCEFCGEPVTRYPSQFAGGRGKYCSKSCANKAKMRRQSFVCPMCGAEFDELLSKCARAKYCSLRCRFQARAETNLAFGRKVAVFTPQFMAALSESKSEVCGYPGCEGPRAKHATEFALCTKHNTKLKTAIWRKRKQRDDILKDHGVSTQKNKSKSKL